MEKLPFEAPKLEITYFEAEDIIRTSNPPGCIGEPDFEATAPDFEWGEWP